MGKQTQAEQEKSRQTRSKVLQITRLVPLADDRDPGWDMRLIGKASWCWLRT